MLKNLEILKKLTPEDILKYETQGEAPYPSQFNYLFGKFFQKPGKSIPKIRSGKSAVSWI